MTINGLFKNLKRTVQELEKNRTEHTTIYVLTVTHRIWDDSFLQTEYCLICKPTQ